MSVGGKASEQSSQSTQQSTTDSNTFVDPGQAPFLQSMYGQASGMVNPGATQAAAQGASNFNAPHLQGGMQNLSGLMDTQGQIGAQTASLQSGLAQLFNEQMMPGIQSNSMMAGGFGGGRQGVAEGVGMGQIGQAFTQGLGDIVARANQTALGAGGMMPGMAQGLFANAIAPTTAGLDPLAQLAQIIGSPTLLSQSAQQSSGQSTSSGSSGGFSFGLT